MRRVLAVLVVAAAVLGFTAVPSHAVAIVCGAGVEGQLVSCTGSLTVDATTNKVTLTFNTFSLLEGGTDGNIQWLGMQFPNADQAVDAANSSGPAGYSIGNFGGAGFSFEAEDGITGAGTAGVGDTPITFVIAYTGSDAVDTAYTAVANQNGTCGGFHSDVWGCLHVQFSTNIVDPDCTEGSCGSQFVPLRADSSVPEPVTLVTLGLGLVTVSLAARRKFSERKLLRR